MTETIYVNGRTKLGIEVLVRKVDDELQIEVGGVRAELTDRPAVYRDGGSRRWRTDLGTITKLHKLNGDRRAFIDGAEVLASDSSSVT